MRPLRFAPIWLTLGWLYACLIIYLSLTSSPPQGPDLPQVDKIFHTIAYFVLMTWFMQIYDSKRPRLVHFYFFLVMGGGLEILQGLGGIRHAEWLDMVANTSGVGLGWWLGDKIRLPLI